MTPDAIPEAGDVVARGAAMRLVLGLAERVAAVDSPVLLTRAEPGRSASLATSTRALADPSGPSFR